MEVGKKIFGRSVARDPRDRKVREEERRARGDHPLALPHLTVADLDSEEKVPTAHGSTLHLFRSR